MNYELRCIVTIFSVMNALGCGGGGGGSVNQPGQVSNATFSIVWPERSRALSTGLSSALSVSVILPSAGVGGADLKLNVDRDQAKIGGYTGTYSFAQPLLPSTLTHLTASFYDESGETGDVVGTATAPTGITGTSLNIGTISLVSKIQTVTISSPPALSVGSTPVQLQFTATDVRGAIVPVTPGSALWTIQSGGFAVNLSLDGIVTAEASGSASITTTVDQVKSSPAKVSVSSVAFNFPNGVGGEIISPSFPAVEGNLFKVNGTSPLTVTALGVQVIQTGQPPETAAIFDATTGDVLASATVSTSNPTSGGYYWQPINPIILSAGSEYYIGALHSSGNAASYIWDTRAATTPNFIIDEGTYFKISSTVEVGSWEYGGGTSQYGSGELRHYLANFMAQPVGP